MNTRNPKSLASHCLHEELGYPEPLDDVLRSRLNEIGLSALDPVDITEGGEILDGRGRTKWAIEKGVESIPVRVLDLDEDQIAEHIIRCNSSGKEIPAASRLKEARRLEEIDKRRANEKRSKAVSERCREQDGTLSSSGPQLGPTGQNAENKADSTRSQEAAADHAGMSKTTYNRAKKAQERAEESGDPEVVEAVDEAINEGNVSKAERASQGKPAKPKAGQKSSRPRVLDGLSRPVHKRHEEVFNGSALDIKRIGTQIGQLIKQVNEAKETPAGFHLEASGIVAALKDAKALVVYGVPYTECPDCLGKVPDPRCQTCLGAGWISRKTAGRLSDHQKNVLREAMTEAEGARSFQ